MEQQVRNIRKVYVDVIAEFTKDGSLIPRYITWEDGRRYEVDRILDRRRAASMRAGGMGIRYTCRICGKVTYLFYEENLKWFVEAKVI